MDIRPSDKKTVIGLSGGVDSTAAALLLKDGGHEVTGVFLDVLGNNSTGRDEAFEAAGQIGIDMISMDVSDEFDKTVISDFCHEYMAGRTPNPCVLCNPEVKFKYLLRAAHDIGAGRIATGHYARVACDEGRYYIYRAHDEKKDQSYVLYRLGQEYLSRLILPLGDFGTKGETRKLAGARGMANSEAKDSQEICFIPKGTHYVNYLTNRGCGIKKGDYIDSGENMIGEHQGIPNYTIGQRKNLGVAFGKPMFVVKIDGESGNVTLGCNEELLQNEVFSKRNWFSKTDSGIMPEEYEGFQVTAKIRYSAALAEARIYRHDGETVRTVFSKPQRAVAPGQSIVFYSGDKVIGGGMIEAASNTL